MVLGVVGRCPAVTPLHQPSKKNVRTLQKNQFGDGVEICMYGIPRDQNESCVTREVFGQAALPANPSQDGLQRIGPIWGIWGWAPWDPMCIPYFPLGGPWASDSIPERDKRRVLLCRYSAGAELSFPAGVRASCGRVAGPLPYMENHDSPMESYDFGCPELAEKSAG